MILWLPYKRLSKQPAEFCAASGQWNHPDLHVALALARFVIAVIAFVCACRGHEAGLSRQERKHWLQSGRALIQRTKGERKRRWTTSWEKEGLLRFSLGHCFQITLMYSRAWAAQVTRAVSKLAETLEEEEDDPANQAICRCCICESAEPEWKWMQMVKSPWNDEYTYIIKSKDQNYSHYLYVAPGMFVVNWPFVHFSPQLCKLFWLWALNVRLVPWRSVGSLRLRRSRPFFCKASCFWFR